MKITDHFSPNFEDRNQPVDTIVLHYTDMKSASEALNRLSDPLAKVSSHYLISKDGQVFRLVPEDKVAYHAGISYWRGRSSLNHSSIGIELDNLGHSHGPEAFSAVQINALIDLMNSIRRRHKVPDHNIVGHSDIAPTRKKDPGELFPWCKLAKQGHGLWSPLLKDIPIQDDLTFFPSLKEKRTAQENLIHIGYQLDMEKDLTFEKEQVLLAFQRHFLPFNIIGSLDKETLQAIQIIKNLIS